MNSKAEVPSTLHGKKVHFDTLMNLCKSRTHRFDSDRLYYHINLDPMILIKYVNTTQLLPDILINGSVLAFLWSFAVDQRLHSSLHGQYLKLAQESFVQCHSFELFEILV